MENDGFKICPFCKEKIRKEAVKCRFCGEWLEEVSRSGSELNQKHESCIPPSQVELGQRPATQPKDSTTTPTALEPAASKPDADQTEPSNKFGSNRPIRNDPFIPSLLIVLWISWFALPQAIEQVGVSSIPYLIYCTLLHCICLISIIVLLLLGNWLWVTRRNFRLFPLTLQTLKGTSVQKAMAIGVIALFSISGFFTYKKIHLALEQRAANDRLYLQARGINPDVFKDWEITKQKADIGNGNTGLTLAAKKRMRELFALQFKGGLGSENAVTVDLQGDDHDKLVISFNGILTPAIADNMTDALQQADPDFWNRMRFLGFSTLTLTGADFSESIPQSKFIHCCPVGLRVEG